MILQRLYDFAGFAKFARFVVRNSQTVTEHRFPHQKSKNTDRRWNYLCLFCSRYQVNQAGSIDSDHVNRGSCWPETQFALSSGLVETDLLGPNCNYSSWILATRANSVWRDFVWEQSWQADALSFVDARLCDDLQGIRTTKLSINSLEWQGGGRWDRSVEWAKDWLPLKTQWLDREGQESEGMWQSEVHKQGRVSAITRSNGVPWIRRPSSVSGHRVHRCDDWIVKLFLFKLNPHGSCKPTNQ